MLSITSKKAIFSLVALILNRGKMERTDKGKYTHKELEAIREELERRIKKEVFLKIETNHYRDDFYQESPVNNLLLWNTKGKNIDYNKELYKKYNKECVHEKALPKSS